MILTLLKKRVKCNLQDTPALSPPFTAVCVTVNWHISWCCYAAVIQCALPNLFTEHLIMLVCSLTDSLTHQATNESTKSLEPKVLYPCRLTNASVSITLVSCKVPGVLGVIIGRVQSETRTVFQRCSKVIVFSQAACRGNSGNHLTGTLTEVLIDWI